MHGGKDLYFVCKVFLSQRVCVQRCADAHVLSPQQRSFGVISCNALIFLIVKKTDDERTSIFLNMENLNSLYKICFISY